MSPEPEVPRLPRYCYEDTDRHGNVRVYLRRPGRKKVRLNGVVWTPEFMRAYEQALSGVAAVVPARAEIEKGSWAALCRGYFTSAEFLANEPRTQLIRRRILEATFSEPIKPGSPLVFRDFPITEMEPSAVRVLRDRKASQPVVANERLKAIRQVFKHAIDERVIHANVAREVPYFKHVTDGFYTWTVDDVQQFEERHPAGSKARRALYLLLYAGPRRSDVVTLGRQMVRRGVLRFRPKKTAKKTGKTLDLTVLPILQTELDLAPKDRLTFLETDFNQPFTANGFGNWFKKRCRESGLPHCSAHGLRKAGATIAAENGATPHQLMAMYGWSSLKQAEIYTRAAGQKRLAHEGAQHLIAPLQIPVGQFDKKA